ncbi:hypothetical protein VNO77_22552 [Canavalia gladiata]|uniref:Uncharacterized protein n=1 Tax=Canavalia gladiata TaxID=3824 RepID=A0AAN9QAN9_CANGL
MEKNAHSVWMTRANPKQNFPTYEKLSSHVLRTVGSVPKPPFAFFIFSSELIRDSTTNLYAVPEMQAPERMLEPTLQKMGKHKKLREPPKKN